MRVLIVLGILVLSVGSANAAYWYENFDEYPVGPLGDQPGWVCNSSQTEVSSFGWDSAPHALYFPPASLTQRYAIWEEVSMAGGDILRISFQLMRENADQLFRLGVRSNTVQVLYISTDSSDSTITVNGFDTGAVYPTGSYARFTLFYDKNTDLVALDVDGTRILDWVDIGVSSFSQIDDLIIQRTSGSSDSGGLYVDDVSVQSLPSDVQVWWRFEEGGLTVANEECGRFRPNTYITYSGGGWEAVPEALYTLYSGLDGVRNRTARDSTRLATLDQARDIDLGSDWTVEFMASIPPTKGVCSFFEWTTFYPPESTTGAWIKIVYVLNQHELHVYLRDDDGGGYGEYVIGSSKVKNDDHWHHFAITKQGATLEAFQDYVSIGTKTLYGSADGNYSFDSACYAYIGQSSSNVWTTESGVLMDEVRISDQVYLPDFLRIDHPRFTRIEVGATTCDLTFFGPPWRTLPIRRRTNMLSGAWVSSGSDTAPTNYLGEEKTVVITKPSPGRGVYGIW